MSTLVIPMFKIKIRMILIGSRPVFYRPQTKFAKVMFLQASVCPQGGGVRGGVCMVARGACGCWGVCVVAGGHVWFLGGCAWLPGVCMAAPLGGACVVGRGGGMHGCWEGMHGCGGVVWLLRACVVAGGRHAWLPGGVYCCWGGGGRA